jgi:hypothetical protein
MKQTEELGKQKQGKTFADFCKLTLEEIELFLFETGVGFLVFRIEYQGDIDPDTIADANYYCKRTLGDNYRLSWDKSTGNGQTDQVATSFADIGKKLLGPLGVSTYFESAVQGENRNGFQILVYSVLLLNKGLLAMPVPEREHTIGDLVFKLRRSFKDSYKPAPAEYALDNNPEVFRAFENSYWGFALEGLANIVYEVDDEVTNHFFRNTYPGNIKKTYFMLYIIALHQRYALTFLNIQATEIEKPPIKAKNIHPIKKLMEKISYFALRGYYSQTGDNTHQAKFYKHIVHMLAIDQLKHELDTEMAMLSTLHKEELDRQENVFKNWLLIMTTVFVGVSTTASYWDIIVNIHKNELGALSDPGLLWGLGVIWVFILAAGCYYFCKFKMKDV